MARVETVESVVLKNSSQTVVKTTRAYVAPSKMISLSAATAAAVTVADELAVDTNLAQTRRAVPVIQLLEPFADPGRVWERRRLTNVAGALLHP